MIVSEQVLRKPFANSTAGPAPLAIERSCRISASNPLLVVCAIGKASEARRDWRTKSSQIWASRPANCIRRRYFECCNIPGFSGQTSLPFASTCSRSETHGSRARVW